MHSLTCVWVVVCVVHKPRPCLSYSRRRDRINSVLWRSYYKGGGVSVASRPRPSATMGLSNHGDLVRPHFSEPMFWRTRETRIQWRKGTSQFRNRILSITTDMMLHSRDIDENVLGVCVLCAPFRQMLPGDGLMGLFNHGDPIGLVLCP